MLAKSRIAGLPEKPSMKPGHRVLLLAILAALVAPACRETSGPELRSGYFAVPEACGSVTSTPSGQLYVWSRPTSSTLKVDAREPDGGIIWSTTLAATAATCTGSVDLEGNLVTPTADSVFSLDERTGSVRWRIAAAGPRPPAIGAEGMVYVGTSGGGGASPTLLAIKASDGSIAWSKDVQDQGGPHLDAARSTVFHVRRGAAAAFNTTTGSLRWEYPVTNADRGFEGAVTDGSIIVGITGAVYSGVASYETAGGTRRWLNLEPAPRNLHAPPILDHEGSAYTAHDANGDALSAVFATDPSTGAVKWKLDFDRIESDLAVDADRIVYVIARTTAQSLYKLYGLRDGAVVSSEPTRWVRRMSYHPLLIHPSGRLYYVTDGEVVFAPTAGVHPSARWPMPGADAQRSRRR